MKNYHLQKDFEVTDEEIDFIEENYEKIQLSELINLYFKTFQTDDIYKFRSAIWVSLKLRVNDTASFHGWDLGDLSHEEICIRTTRKIKQRLDRTTRYL